MAQDNYREVETKMNSIATTKRPLLQQKKLPLYDIKQSIMLCIFRLLSQ